VHVVASTLPSALRYSSTFAIKLVQGFFRKYAKVDPDTILELSDGFRNLEMNSSLEIAFEGKPKGVAVPSYSTGRDYIYIPIPNGIPQVYGASEIENLTADEPDEPDDTMRDPT
jgi:hypothetical protein